MRNCAFLNSYPTDNLIFVVFPFICGFVPSIVELIHSWQTTARAEEMISTLGAI